MPLVKIVATGGTVANTVTGRLSVDELLRDIPEAKEIADLEISDVLRLASRTFTPSEWLKIGYAVADAAEDDRVDGIVVTHGTLTAEETAYFLHLVVRTSKPIVIVCAQRKHRMSGNDGDRNFLDALRIATSESAQGKGVFVTLGEEIHSARDVVKTNQRPGGFVSRSGGILGHVESDGTLLPERAGLSVGAGGHPAERTREARCRTRRHRCASRRTVRRDRHRACRDQERAGGGSA